ncbi:MAG: BamA/TamA family outer membrane protein [Alistipes sp.]|nr:BamA/TamA family outer membrane protein [Alistipes sp.]
MSSKRVIVALIALLSISTATAQTDSIFVSGRDSIPYKYTPITTDSNKDTASTEATDKASIEADTLNGKKPKKMNFFRRFYRYFAESATDKTFEKRFDVTFIGGPSYSESASLGLGLYAAGLYRIDRSNRKIAPSNVSLYFNITIIGRYTIGIEGNNIFKDDKHRLTYDIGFRSQPSYFWGLGYNAAMGNRPVEYRCDKQQIRLTYLYRIFKNAFIGAQINFDNLYSATGRNIPELMRGYLNERQGVGIDNVRTDYLSTALSLSLEYDSRDFIPNPSRGIYISLSESIRPKGLGDVGKTMWSTKVIVDYYKKLWKGCVLALDLYGEFNSKGTPWVFYAKMGGSSRMRGFYDGRFNDRNMITFQAELRQNIWRRIGATVWGGAGNVFQSFDTFRWDQTMPNYGIGLRWEFKKRVNIRIDYGFGMKDNYGRMIHSFMFQINEAF